MAPLLFAFALGDRPAFLAILAATETPDPLSLLITYGPLGIFLVLLATGQFRTKFEVQRLEKQVEQGLEREARKDELIRAFQMQLTGHTLPALAQSARVFEAIPNAENDLIGQLRRAREEAAVLAKQLESLSRGETQ